MLRHWKYDPAADPYIKLLIRAFTLEWPVQRRIIPKWDLHLVLSALMSSTFASEVYDRGRISDDVIDLRWWTMKTMFLLALASARWRSYLHALSVAHGRRLFGRGNTQSQMAVSLLPEARLQNGSPFQVSCTFQFGTYLNYRSVKQTPRFTENNQMRSLFNMAKHLVILWITN